MPNRILIIGGEFYREGEPGIPDWYRDVGPEQDTANWWECTASSDLAGFLPKLEEYGSRDLVSLGHDLLSMIGWEDQPDRVAGEVGAIFYLRGKIARAMEAIGHHKLPSDDTEKDMTVYSMMARRFRANGSL